MMRLRETEEANKRLTKIVMEAPLEVREKAPKKCQQTKDLKMKREGKKIVHKRRETTITNKTY